MSGFEQATADGDGTGLRCDCGYVSSGSSLEDRVRDARRHARQAHGIEVTPAQVLGTTGAGAPS